MNNKHVKIKRKANEIPVLCVYTKNLNFTSKTIPQNLRVRVTFGDRVNHIHNLNLAPTLTITSTNSKPKNSLTLSRHLTSDVTVTGGK